MTMPLSVTVVAGAAFAAFVLADLLSEVLRRVAARCGALDRPDPRKAHTRPTPYLGGVAIAVATLASGVALIPYWDHRIGTLVVASAVVALAGLSDDLRPAHPGFRLAAECVAATAVVISGGRIGLFGGWADAVLSVLWIVVLTNSFNLLDNMDGAATMVAVPSAGLLAGAAYLTGRYDLALLLAALAAGCLGFLVHNWAPARMFMGDAGSLFIGFLIAVAVILVPVPSGPVPRLAELFLFTFVATVDTCLVVIARPRAGRSCFTAGTDHTSHRLHVAGLSVRRVGIALFAVAALSCLCGVGVAHAWLPGGGALAVAVPVAVAAILLLLRIPAYAPADGAPETDPLPAAVPNR